MVPKPRQRHPIYNIVLSDVRYEGDNVVLAIEVRDRKGTAIYSLNKVMSASKFSRMSDEDVRSMLKKIYKNIKPIISKIGMEVTVEG